MPDETPPSEDETQPDPVPEQSSAESETEETSPALLAEPAGAGLDLFSTVCLGKLEVANRVVLSPLDTGLASAEGKVTPALTAYLSARARGGAGLIMAEPANVSEQGLTHGRMLRASSDDHASGLRELVEAVHAAGAPVCLTLTQGPVDDLIELSAAELPAQFARAARRAHDAGADALALQFGDGHALGQLLSRRSAADEKDDEDSEGDDNELDARCEASLAVLGAVRAEVGADFPLIACVTLDECREGGLAGDEALEVARRLAEAGVEAVLVTAGAVQSRSFAAPCHYVTPLLAPPLAAKAKEVVTVPIIVAGGIRTLAEAQEILTGGQADLVGMPRALLADPELAVKQASGRSREITPCIACNQACVVGPGGGRRIGCVTNPRAGFEHEPLPLRFLESKELVVVGGGPAGIVGAVAAARRGFRVTLFEQDDELGGRFRLATVPPHKGLLGRYVDWLRHALENTEVEVRLGERADYETLRGLAPDVVLIAAGASLDLPESIPGIDEPLMPGFVVTADAVLAGEAAVGKRVMVVGARRVGLETADLLAEDGRHVTVCDSSQAPDALVPNTVKPLLEERLKRNGVEVLADATVTRVRDAVVFVRHEGHVVQFDDLDTVVVACGWKRNDELAARLAEHIDTVAVVGDARSPRTAMAAIREAYQTVAEL